MNLEQKKVIIGLPKEIKNNEYRVGLTSGEFWILHSDF